MKTHAARLADVCERIDYGFTASADFSVKEPRLLRITDIQNDAVDWNLVPGCQISTKDESDARLEKGDIVVARTGATTGKSFLIKHSPRAVFASYLIRLRAAADVLPEYLFGFCQSECYWRQIRRAVRGAAQGGVNSTLLSSLILPLPSMTEQKQIADQLEQADRLRRTRRYTLELSDSFLPAAFLEFFGDLQSGSGKKAELYEVAEILTGYPFTSEDYTEPGDTIRLCRGANILPDRIDWSDLALWPKSKSHDLSKYRLQVGDVVIAMDRPWISEGFKIAQIRPEHCPTLLVQRVARLRGKNDVPNAFLYHLLRHPAFTRHCRPTETTIPHISPTDIETFSFHVPSLAMQQQFAALAMRHERLRATQREALRQAEHLFQTLLHQAFSQTS